MSIHHLNCGSMRPYVPRVHGIVYCLLVETNDGLVLVDTGFGTRDYTEPTPLMHVFTALLRTPRDLDETAARQVARLGYAVEDVRHIACTHLHLDHAGGLPDFPDASVHVYGPEYRAAMQPKRLLERFYLPAHWAHGPKWVIHELTGEKWFDFDSIPIADGLSPRVLLIPLPGHTRGHCGVAVETAEGWLLHCGDAAYPFYHKDPPAGFLTDPPGWLVRWLLGPHVPRLRALVREHGDEVRLITSHDAYGFDLQTRVVRV
jgi:glyoxylase-like metal-dependent hydrolase (beta-lactamase superfamily II)